MFEEHFFKKEFLQSDEWLLIFIVLSPEVNWDPHQYFNFNPNKSLWIMDLAPNFSILFRDEKIYSSSDPEHNLGSQKLLANSLREFLSLLLGIAKIMERNSDRIYIDKPNKIVGTNQEPRVSRNPAQQILAYQEGLHLICGEALTDSIRYWKQLLLAVLDLKEEPFMEFRKA